MSVLKGHSSLSAKILNSGVLLQPCECDTTSDYLHFIVKLWLLKKDSAPLRRLVVSIFGWSVCWFIGRLAVRSLAPLFRQSASLPLIHSVSQYFIQSSISFSGPNTFLFLIILLSSIILMCCKVVFSMKYDYFNINLSSTNI